MRYRLQVLTPTLVGDGSALSPIDYMVWKDQVNVLDQKRIFRLLSKGPRLDGYLNQVKKAEKLDFASWGGFAQNFAGRRIPFEHPDYSRYWDRLRAEHCFIPTFAAALDGAYLPGSALKGALRTALISSLADSKAVEAAKGERRLGDAFEAKALSREWSRGSALKTVSIGDSKALPLSSFKVYMLRTATLVEMRPPQKGYGLGWKQSPRGSVDSRRIEESTPQFAEMAPPGTLFEGASDDREFYQTPEVLQSLHWKSALTRRRLLQSANQYARTLLQAHRQFATMTGLTPLLRTIDALDQRLGIAEQQGNACMLVLGWGTGLFGKVGFPKFDDPAYRDLLADSPHYGRAIRSGMPFPKTRRIVFMGNQPAALPGWCWLEVN